MRNPADVKAHIMVRLIRNKMSRNLAPSLFFVQITNVKHMGTN